MSGFGYNVLGFGANASGAAGGASDDQFNRVSFLSHFDGANNGVNNAFDDSSSNDHTISNTGSPTQGSFGPFARPDGEWGVSFDGTNDGLRLQSSDFGISTEAFTAECWVFPTKVPDNSDSFMWCMDATQSNASGNTWALRANNGKVQVFTVSSGTLTTKESTASLNINAWNHVAISRSGTTMYVALNGTVESATCASSLNNQQYLHIGCAASNVYAYFFQGIISNARYLVGTALYTSDYTVPTGKLTAITNTDLLTCQSNRFVDNSASGHAITITGEPAVTAFGPFLTSAVYDATVNGASSQLGATNYVHIADGAWKTLGTGDFTWEYWIYPIGENAYHVGDATAGTNISSTFTLGVSGKRLILYYSIAGEEAYPIYSPDSAPYYNNNEWLHLAYVRSGNDHKIYANGILRASETRSGTMVDSTGQFNIGNFGEGYAIGAPDGIYCDVRLVKGTAVYSGSTYTVPTAPLTAISNTELLVNFKDGQAIDSAAQNNITLGGNANTSTDQAKFGDTSLHLDGTTDYAEIVNVQGFGTGDFTIEGFYRFASFTSQGNLFDFRTALSSALPLLSLNLSGELKYVVTGANRISAGSGNELSTNTWYHIALCRGSGSTKLFVDGTQVGSTYSDSITYLTAPIVRIGARSYSATPNQNIDGFVDDFRISRMARYTSNFTAPSEPFADKGQ